MADGLADLIDGIGADTRAIDSAASFRPFDIRLLWNTLGVLGEGAEIANIVLTQLESGDFDKAALAKEIGDLCWYLTALCTMADLDFGAVLAANIAKLKARYPAGWDAVKSQQRDLAAEAARA
jgi:NTP pyrophosphatase (non-canonical NTP hydrolase)